MTPQHAITILGELAPDQLDEVEVLREDLRQLGDAMDAGRDRELRALHDTERIHFMSFFIVDAEPGVGPAYVGLEVSWDGRRDDFYDEAARLAAPTLARLFGRCLRFPARATGGALARYLADHDRGADAFYVGTPDRSLKQIRRERVLRTRVGHEVQRVGWRNTAARTWRAVQARFPEAAVPPALRSPAVRWSLRDGFAVRLGGWVRLAAGVLLLALAALGLVDLMVRAGVAFGAAPPANDVASAWVTWLLGVRGPGLVCLAPPLSAMALVWPWWRESPSGPSWRGRALLLRVLARRWLSWTLSAALVLGLIGVCPRLSARLPGVAADALLVVGALALVLAAGGFFMLAFGRLLGGALGAGALGGWLALMLGPPAPAPLSEQVAFGLTLLLGVGLGSALALLGGLFAFGLMYVAWGRLASVLGACGLALAWSALLLEHWQSPARLLVYFAALLLVLALSVAAQLAALLLSLRALEASAPQAEARWDLAHLERVQRREDRTEQNHLVNVSTIAGAPGSAAHRLRLSTLRGVLRAVSLAARMLFNRGDLGGIKSIHFARFLILPDRRRLLFLSNYDGAFASYLGDFTDVVGVTAVWGNTIGFPRPLFLLWEGIRDEQRFKAFGRSIQRETLGWYSAYPDLSVQDVDAATALREALSREVAAEPLAPSARSALSAPELTEADCDEALRRV